MAATRTLLLILRASSIGLLIFLIVELGLIYDSDIFNVWEILSVIGMIRDMVSYLVYIVLYYVFYGLVSMVGSMFAGLGIDFNYFYFFSMESFTNIVGRWFYLPGIESATPTISEATAGLSLVFTDIRTDLFMLILQIIAASMFYFAIRASLTSNPGDSIRVVILINAIIVIPMFFIALYDVLNTFMTLNIPFIEEIIALDLIRDTMYYEVSNNFAEFLSSEIFRVALISFLYLEMTFQMSYVDKVTSPSIEREARLSYQIEIIHEEAEKAVANLARIKERKREERLLARTVEKMEEEMEEKKRLSLRTFMSEGEENSSFSFVSELIEKKKREKEEKKMMDTMRDTRKVANFLDKLFKQDPEAKATLTAKTAAPKSSNLVSSTLINIATRVFLISILTWACVHPYYVFVNIFNSPDAIAESVELQTYEAVLSLLIPIILVLPLAATIIKVTKHGKLKELLRLEELRRLGMTEEEYKEMMEQRAKRLEQEELNLKRDQDAIKHMQKKTPQQTANNP